MKRWIWVGVLGVACSGTSEPLYQPDPNGPEEVAAGLFRLTFNAGGDYPRTFLADGRLLYQASDLAGAGAGRTLESVDPLAGGSREELGPYQTALAPEQLTMLTPGSLRVLLGLTPPEMRVHWCGDPTHPAPAPPYAGWHLYRLPESDGAPISSLFAPARELPVFVGAGRDSTGALYTNKRIRIVPAIAEADSLGTNPWGPTLTADGHAYLSDAVAIWRYDLTDSTAAPDSITAGAYPLLSPDGATLYLARPNIVDSTQTVTVVAWSLFTSCLQTMVRYRIDGWTLVRRTIATGVEDTIGSGAEPVPGPGSTLVVRRPDGIYQVDAAGGAILLYADSTATSPVLSADGTLLAIASRRAGNADVYVLHLQ